MRKLLCVVLAVLMLCGCAGGTVPTEHETTVEDEPAQTTNPEYAENPCSICGGEFHKDGLVNHDGDWYCARCLSERLYELEYSLKGGYGHICRDCGEFFKTVDVPEACSTYGYCEDCYTYNLGRCYRCGDYCEYLYLSSSFTLCYRCEMSLFSYPELRHAVAVSEAWDLSQEYYEETKYAVDEFMWLLLEYSPN